jgi:hypothetical protein
MVYVHTELFSLQINLIILGPSSSISNINEIIKADPDLTTSQAQYRNKKQTNPRDEFLKYLQGILYNVRRRKELMSIEHESYSFTVTVEAKINKVCTEFEKMLTDSSKSWILYCQTNRFNINSVDYGSYRDILYATDEQHQKDIFWWIDVTLNQELLNINRENTLNRWITLEINSDVYFRESYVDAKYFEQNLNFTTANALIDTLSKNCFHFLMSTEKLHACFIPLPLLTREDVEDLIFKSMMIF